ncbi:ribonuclease HI family protein [Candidatus Pacebacteria bacterium]|nr:ribonuclease HI family protein [Candidatus Paceibacterota bacterium]
MEKVIAYTDGGSRGNPGPAAVGVYIVDEAGTVLREVKETIGNSTNNIAEYTAVLTALETLKAMHGQATTEMMVEIRLNSELIQKQLSGEYQITEPGLVSYFIAIHNLRVTNFPQLTLTQVKREENTEADRLVNEALDGK